MTKEIMEVNFQNQGIHLYKKENEENVNTVYYIITIIGSIYIVRVIYFKM